MSTSPPALVGMRRHGRLVGAAAAGFAVALLAVLFVGRVQPGPSRMQAVDRYLMAVQKGDSAALERLIPAADARRDALIRRHDGHPATVASMTLDSTPSAPGGQLAWHVS
jgi:hypothetical protein